MPLAARRRQATQTGVYAMHICIDGTGKATDREYDLVMRNSFVRRIFDQTCDKRKRYTRGPNLLDMTEEPGGDFRGSTEDIADWAAAWTFANVSEDNRIFLVGYSRGAAACVRVAQLLKARRLRVEAMFLFDAVNWAWGVNSDKIPDNVRSVWHAVRIVKCFGQHSRWYFGHTARECESSQTSYTEKVFNASHAALGGLPGTGDVASEVPMNYFTYAKLGDPDPGGVLKREYNFEYANEVAVSRKVWDWMSHAREAEWSEGGKLDAGTEVRYIG